MRLDPRLDSMILVMVSMTGLSVLVCHVIILTLGSSPVYETRTGELIQTVYTLTDKVEALNDRVQTLEITLSELKEDDSGSGCGSSFILNESPRLCYKVMSAKSLSMIERMMFCAMAAPGGRLAVLEDFDVLNVVKEQIKNGPKKNYIIGGNYHPGGIWKWHNGKVANPKLFCPGEPSGSGECFSMWGEKGYCLDNISCNEYTPFVCEMPM